MNKLYTSIVLIITALALMSNSGGRGATGNEAVTGAPGENGRTCGSSNCHDDGQFDPSVSVEILSAASGNSKEGYKPNSLYTTRVTVSTTGTPGGYGFQMVALNGGGESVGEWTASDDTQTVSLDGRSYIEHNKRIADSVIVFSWLSPATDEGDVTFYISANAVNGTGSPAADGATNNSFVFSYDGTTSTSDESLDQTLIYPNPAVDQINITNHNSNNFSIYNVQGQNVQEGSLINDQIDIENLNPGMYILQLDNNKEISRFIKI